MKDCEIDLTSLEPRLQKRSEQLIKAHLHASQALASAAKPLPSSSSTFAATQAAWRFYNNPRVKLTALAQPLLEHARQALQEHDHRFGLVMHDWSSLSYNSHASKKDRARLQHRRHWGYELQSSLLVCPVTGQPLAPLVQDLRTKEGIHSTRTDEVLKSKPRLDLLTPRLDYLRSLNLGRPLVHIIDREGDSVGHYRQWQRQKHWFLVRAKGRPRVQEADRSCSLAAVAQEMEQTGALQFSQRIEFQGRPARQYVGEKSVVLTRAARPTRRRGQAKRRQVPGEPIRLRLIVSQVRSEEGKVLATWLLLSNLDQSVSAQTIAQWYYWRWRIESFFKLLKGAGHEVENWQQENGLALARRLLIASMACVWVWELARNASPAGEQLRQTLVRLSGRQMKRGRTWTAPALLAGAQILLTMLEVLEHEDIGKLKDLAKNFL